MAQWGEMNNIAEGGLKGGYFIDRRGYIENQDIYAFIEENCDLAIDEVPREPLPERHGLYVIVVNLDATSFDVNNTNHMTKEFWPWTDSSAEIENGTNKTGVKCGAFRLWHSSGSMKGQPHIKRQISWLVGADKAPLPYLLYQICVSDPNIAPMANLVQDNLPVQNAYIDPTPPPNCISGGSSTPSTVELTPKEMRTPLDLNGPRTKQILGILQNYIQDMIRCKEICANPFASPDEKDYYEKKCQEIQGNIAYVTDRIHRVGLGIVSLVRKLNEQRPIERRNSALYKLNMEN